MAATAKVGKLGHTVFSREDAMVLSTANICAFGWKARDFALQGVDGKTYSLADVRGPNGTLVVFICNHCPYVKASIDRIVAEAKALREIGIGTIAIMPNDTDAYPEDSFDKMKAFSTDTVLLSHTLSIRRRRSRAFMTLSARRISSASTHKTNCSIAGGSMLRAYSRRQMRAANCSKR